jgi:hypothetical protein
MPTTRSARSPLHDMSWLACWIKACEIAWTAPLVIGNRTLRMMAGGWPPNAREQRELRRMTEEKAAAFWEASLAAAKVWPAITASGVEATLAPVHRRVVANNRRLGKR